MPRGPAPDPNRQRRNADPLLSKDGWTEIDPEPNDGDIPPIPDWIQVNPGTQAIYEYLMSLPQARLYGPGTMFELWISLPLIEKYLNNPKGPSVEVYKGLVSALGSALRLTEDDMLKGRVKMKQAEEAEESETAQGNAKVISIKDRKNRALGA